MNDLNAHYRQLLGLGDDWQVVDVDLDLAAGRVIIDLEHAGGKLCCPECSQPCDRADTAPKRTWRHLDTMQFATEIRAAVPRSQCARCGVKTIAVPWAGKHSRFTLMFEALAIRVLQAASNVSRAAGLLGLAWDAAHFIMATAIERGLERRETEDVQHVSVDEKSFGKGHDYVSVLTDIDQSRVREVVRDRTTAACDQLWKTLTKQQLDPRADAGRIQIVQTNAEPKTVLRSAWFTCPDMPKVPSRSFVASRSRIGTRRSSSSPSIAGSV